MLMGYIDISVYFDFSLYCYLALDRNRIPFYSILSNHIGLVTSLLAKGLPPLTAIPYRPSPPVLPLYLPLQSVDPRPILTWDGHGLKSKFLIALHTRSTLPLVSGFLRISMHLAKTRNFYIDAQVRILFFTPRHSIVVGVET